MATLSTDRPITPLRQRMLDGMLMRGRTAGACMRGFRTQVRPKPFTIGDNSIQSAVFARLKFEKLIDNVGAVCSGRIFPFLIERCKFR